MTGPTICPGGLLYGDDVIHGARGYASGPALMQAFERQECARSWWLGTSPVSIELAKEYGGGTWKRSDRFRLDRPAEQLGELAALGIDHPSSYSDVYWTQHETLYKAKPVPLRSTYNKIFDWWAGGPWSEARMIGRLPGAWYRYDLRSAYRWAATQRLPDPSTYVVRSKMGSAPGVWVVEPLERRIDVAPALRGTGLMVLSSEEIDAMKFRCKIVRGVTWEKTLPWDYIERILETLPCPKECGRAYWGRFIGRDPLIVRTPTREWSLRRNPWQNMAWGWLIVGRVRLRVWQASAGRAAHVYVDEMVVPFQLPGEMIGDAPGQWREKRRYPRGVDIVRTGHFGPADGPPDMYTGVGRDGQTEPTDADRAGAAA